MTVAEVKTFSLEKNNLDSTLLSRFILPAQRQYIKPFLGEDYYNQILTQVETASLDADNTILLENFLKQALAYYVVCDSLPTIRARVDSKGVMINDAEGSDPAERDDYAAVRNQMDAFGSRWLKDAFEYVKEAREADSTKFPLFQVSCDSEATIGKGKVSIYIPS